MPKVVAVDRIRSSFAVVVVLLGVVTVAPGQTAPVDSGCPAAGQRRGPGGPGGPGGPPGAAPAGLPGGAAGQAAPGAGNEGAPTGPPRKRLLIWADTQNGIGQHDLGHAMAVIEELGFKSGIYDTYIRTDSAIISRHPKTTTGQPASGGASLCNVDAIFFLGHREIALTPDQRADLLWFVHDAGKGFVGAHTAITAFESWPEFNELIGAQFDNHPWGIITAPVIVTDPNFPGMKQFGPVVDLKEEFYQPKNFSTDKMRVLMRLDTSKLDMTKPQVQAKDWPYPLTWAKNYGTGRVFYSALGHAPATWDDPRVQQMYFEAIKWALRLTDADVSPLPMPPPPSGAATK